MQHFISHPEIQSITADVHPEASFANHQQVQQLQQAIERFLRNTLPSESHPDSRNRRNLFCEELSLLRRISGLPLPRKKRKKGSRRVKPKSSGQSYQQVRDALFEAASSTPDVPFFKDVRTYDVHASSVDALLTEQLQMVGLKTVTQLRQDIQKCFSKSKPVDLPQLKKLREQLRKNFIFRKLPLHVLPRVFTIDELVIMHLEAGASTFRAGLSTEIVQKGLARKPCDNGIREWQSIVRNLLQKLDLHPDDLSDRCLERIVAFCNRTHDPRGIQKNSELFTRETRTYIRYLIDRSSSEHNYTQEELERAVEAIQAGPSCAPPL